MYIKVKVEGDSFIITETPELKGNHYEIVKRERLPMELASDITEIKLNTEKEDYFSKDICRWNELDSKRLCWKIVNSNEYKNFKICG